MRSAPPSRTQRGRLASRLFVLAAHPDDESLGAGGLIATAAAQGVAVTVVVATTAQTGSSKEQIKNYILNAFTTWPVPPEYVVLVGDAAAIPVWYDPVYDGTTFAPFKPMDDQRVPSFFDFYRKMKGTPPAARTRRLTSMPTSLRWAWPGMQSV